MIFLSDCGGRKEWKRSFYPSPRWPGQLLLHVELKLSSFLLWEDAASVRISNQTNGWPILCVEKKSNNSWQPRAAEQTVYGRGWCAADWDRKIYGTIETTMVRGGKVTDQVTLHLAKVIAAEHNGVALGTYYVDGLQTSIFQVQPWWIFLLAIH